MSSSHSWTISYVFKWPTWLMDSLHHIKNFMPINAKARCKPDSRRTYDHMSMRRLATQKQAPDASFSNIPLH